MDLISVTFTLITFAFIFSLLSPHIPRLLQSRTCTCVTCRAFLTSSWSPQYNNLCDWYTHLLSASPTGTIHLHVLRTVITSNPANVRHILNTRFPNYPKGKPFSVILGDLLGKGIFNSDGRLWNFQRKMAALELGTLSVRSYAFAIVSRELESRLLPLLSAAAGEGNVLDLQDIFRRFSLDTICRFSFGSDPGCLDPSLPDSEFGSAFDLASKLSAERASSPSPLTWKVKRFFNLGSEKKLKDAIKSVHDLADKMILEKRNSSSSSTVDHEDLLARFMSTVNDDVFLRDIVVSFLLAGRDTVASGLTSFFWLMSRNPEAVEMIRCETDRVMGRENESVVGFAQLREMHYLNAAVHESLRLFPPVQFDSKFCEESDFLADGTFVARGTRVTYHPYAMGRMERIWGGDCLEFKPERWLRGGVFMQEDPFKYPVFQAGPRVCLGKEMALVEMKIVALSLIRKFDFEVAGSGCDDLKFAPGLTATITGGLPVIVRRYTCQ